MRNDLGWARSSESMTVATAHGFGTGSGNDNVAIYHGDFIANVLCLSEQLRPEMVDKDVMKKFLNDLCLHRVC
jgi:hypothetical protein